MPKLALVAWLLYIAVALVYRALRQIKLTRSSGIVLPSRDTPPIELLANSLVVGSLLLALLATVVALLAPQAAFFAVPSGIPQMWLATGAVLYAIGLCTTLAAQLVMGRSWRVGVDPGQRTDLVVHGPFRFVRNPIYTAMLLGIAGITALAPSPAALTAYALMFLGLELQVRAVEEPYLMRVHGDTYRQYAAHTGRFLPGLGHL